MTLTLHGGGRARITACGASHHYRTYAPGAAIAYSGQVAPIPSAHWKVKLRIKRCTGAVFTEWAKVEAVRNSHTGTFRGTFTAPPRGDYSVRAVLYVNDSVVRESAKRHFASG